MTDTPSDDTSSDPGDDPTDYPADRLRTAVAEASVGAEDLFDDLAALDALGEIDVVEGVATVPVTVPIPEADLRASIERQIADAAADSEGIDSVAVEWTPSAADPGERVDLLPGVKNVVAVASGKGGVGKSTVAANLAVALSEAGTDVGLLDADVHGPNAPTLLGVDDRTPAATADDEMVPPEVHGIRVMSMGFIADEDGPVIWRGVLVDEFLQQLFDDVAWGDLDYLVVDMPPGTGDAQLSLVQHLPVSGVVVVTTPQAVAVDDAIRGLTGFARYEVPVLGVVENMAGFRCPDCGAVHDIFGEGGATEIREQFDVPVLGRIPLDPAVGTVSVVDDEAEKQGISVPLFGRLRMPRTREERESADRLPPVVLRDDADHTARALRRAAARVAARVEAAAQFRTRDDFEEQIAVEHRPDAQETGDEDGQDEVE